MTTHAQIDATAGAVQAECDPDYPIHEWPPTDHDELEALDAYVDAQERRYMLENGFDPFTMDPATWWDTHAVAAIGSTM